MLDSSQVLMWIVEMTCAQDPIALRNATHVNTVHMSSIVFIG